jgi:hypothetical protein
MKIWRKWLSWRTKTAQKEKCQDQMTRCLETLSWNILMFPRKFLASRQRIHGGFSPHIPSHHHNNINVCCSILYSINILYNPQGSVTLPTLYPQKLALTSPTSGGRSIGIVRSRTHATDFSFFLVFYIWYNVSKDSILINNMYERVRGTRAQLLYVNRHFMYGMYSMYVCNVCINAVLSLYMCVEPDSIINT